MPLCVVLDAYDDRRFLVLLCRLYFSFGAWLTLAPPVFTCITRWSIVFVGRFTDQLIDLLRLAEGQDNLLAILVSGINLAHLDGLIRNVMVIIKLLLFIFKH